MQKSILLRYKWRYYYSLEFRLQKQNKNMVPRRANQQTCENGPLPKKIEKKENTVILY